LHLPGRFINADMAAREIDPVNPRRVSFAAGQRVLLDLDEAIQKRLDFVYETTLSSHQAIALIQRAVDESYEVGLVFVALRDADLHVARVAQRVAEGGHDIPEAVIRRRYYGSMARLAGALRLVHGATIFDNSALRPIMLARISRGVVEVNDLTLGLPMHAQIAASLDTAFG
jgi:predicted ABC-type ATPase